VTDSLAGAFDAATRDQWLGEVRRVLLKSSPDATDEEFVEAFNRRLVTRTDDGIAIQPLYTAADSPVDDLAPGQAPFVRSTHAAPRAWEIRQRVWPALPDSSAVSELESGATGVLLTLTDSLDDGDALVTRALQGVLLDLAPVSISAADPQGQVAAARTLMRAWESAGISPDARRGSLGLDPLGTWARAGGAFDLDAAVSEAADVVRDAGAQAPAVRVMVVDGTVWHEAGATQAQELAWTIASGVWMVRELVARGLPLAQATASLEFRFAATDDQFVTIAKLRAARRLWARVAELAGLDEPDRAMTMHAEVSRVMLTRYDTWVNTLRSTVACFAAGVGGADAITVLPHDALISEGGTSLGRRVARNTQSILQLESHLARVIDPAGGSWFVESLTTDLADAAWTLVQETDSSGGIVTMLEAQGIHDRLDQARESRQEQVATRRRPLTGLSEFPNIDELPPPVTPATSVGESSFPPVTLHRLSEDFEEQRARADAQAAAGERPVIFLATLGTVAESTARATYAKNLFEAGGIRTVSGSVADFASADATVACLCSTDALYADEGAAAVELLREEGATRVYLAGRGVDLAGVDEEVGVGCNVLDVLTRALDSLGVAR